VKGWQHTTRKKEQKTPREKKAMGVRQTSVGTKVVDGEEDSDKRNRGEDVFDLGATAQNVLKI